MMLMRAIALAATAVMCAACAGHDQPSDGASAPKVTPAGIVDRLNEEINDALAEPKPTPVTQGTTARRAGDQRPGTSAQVSDANAAGEPQPARNKLCATIAASGSNFELQCESKNGSE
jgi:hypothetical protein